MTIYVHCKQASPNKGITVHNSHFFLKKINPFCIQRENIQFFICNRPHRSSIFRKKEKPKRNVPIIYMSRICIDRQYSTQNTQHYGIHQNTPMNENYQQKVTVQWSRLLLLFSCLFIMY